jgi:hypothetical protein
LCEPTYCGMSSESPDRWRGTVRRIIVLPLVRFPLEVGSALAAVAEVVAGVAPERLVIAGLRFGPAGCAIDGRWGSASGSWWRLLISFAPHIGERSTSWAWTSCIGWLASDVAAVSASNWAFSPYPPCTVSRPAGRLSRADGGSGQAPCQPV